MNNSNLQSIASGPTKKRVVVSASGKFHALRLASALNQIGYLEKIFIGYPKLSLRRPQIPAHKISSLSFKEPLYRILSRLPFLNKEDLAYYTSDLFDYFVSRRILPCDIFWGWSECSLRTMRKIRKSFEAILVLERGSSHIGFQHEILKKEQEVLGVKVNLPSSLIIEKELQEYDEADYIVVPSKYAKETFLKKGIDCGKVIDVLLGVDLDIFPWVLKRDDIFRIVSVGVSIRKGTHYLLEAVKRLKIKEMELWLLGNFSQDIIHFLKRHSDAFRYIGGVPQHRLSEYYCQGSVFVLFSIEDGFGMSLLEAMACGLPVICSDAVGAKEVVRDGVDGFVVPSRDVNSLSEKLLYFYQNPKRAKEMGTAAFERVSKFFSWRNYNERIESVCGFLRKG